MSTITKKMEDVTMKKAIIARQDARHGGACRSRVGLAEALVGIMMVLILAVNQVQAENCQIVNGSFEDDGLVNFPPPPGEPNGWDVNIDYNKFDGYIGSDWPTDGFYNLTLYAISYASFDVNDTAMVSQPVNLTDANEIIFDLRMRLLSGVSWDPNKASAVVLIDGEVAWDSNDRSSGEYYDQAYAVEDKYRDGVPHTVAFGLRVNVSGYLWQRYITDWDYIECTGFNCLAEDFNHDGLVNFLDFAMLANYWGEAAPSEYDLFVDGIIDNNDLKVFVENWLKRSCIEEQPIE